MKGGFYSMTSRQYTHLTLEERKEVESFLNYQSISLKQIAATLNRSPKCIRYEITHHRILRIKANQRNKCGRQNDCEIRRLCTHCISGLCKHCSHDNCNELCDQFISSPICPRVSRFPYVCSGCKSLNTCKMPKYFYFSDIAQQQYMRNIRSWKEGPKLDEAQLADLSIKFQKGKELGHSVDIIVNENHLPISTSTAYRYIKNRHIAGYINIDAKRAVRYKQRTPKPTPLNYDWLEGRRYQDYLDFLEKYPDVNVWQMDTIIGKQGYDEKCVLSLFYPKSKLQLYFLLDHCISLEVERVFDGIKNYLGSALFKETFSVILTDNGHEFHDPLCLETNPITGESVIHIFYCDPRHSEQKGGCEKNHEHFREICPKGLSMNSLSKHDIRYASNMINNYPRKSLQYHTPIQVSKFFLHPKILKLNDLRQLDSKQVKLKPIIHK